MTRVVSRCRSTWRGTRCIYLEGHDRRHRGHPSWAEYDDSFSNAVEWDDEHSDQAEEADDGE